MRLYRSKAWSPWPTNGFRGDNPRVPVVAEDARVFLYIPADKRKLRPVRGGTPCRRAGAARCRAWFPDTCERIRAPFRLAVLHADTAHDAVALAFDVNLAVLAFLRADFVPKSVVRADEPLAVPAVAQDGFVHRVDFLLAGVRLVVKPAAAQNRDQIRPIGDEHARNQHGFRHALIRRVRVGEGLEGSPGLSEEAVRSSGSRSSRRGQSAADRAVPCC